MRVLRPLALSPGGESLQREEGNCRAIMKRTTGRSNTSKISAYERNLMGLSAKRTESDRDITRNPAKVEAVSLNGSDDTGFCRPFACFHDSVTIDLLSRLVEPFFMDFLVGCDREVFFKKTDYPQKYP